MKDALGGRSGSVRGAENHCLQHAQLPDLGYPRLTWSYLLAGFVPAAQWEQHLYPQPYMFKYCFLPTILSLVHSGCFFEYTLEDIFVLFVFARLTSNSQVFLLLPSKHWIKGTCHHPWPTGWLIWSPCVSMSYAQTLTRTVFQRAVLFPPSATFQSS